MAVGASVLVGVLIKEAPELTPIVVKLVTDLVDHLHKRTTPITPEEQAAFDAQFQKDLAAARAAASTPATGT